jgi:hypothetical protein
VPDLDYWEVISDADSGRVVLGVDFPAARRRVGFAELSARIGPRYRFLQIKPPAVRLVQRPRGEVYVGRWVEGIRKESHQVLAVLGHCVGGLYAAAIAAGIARRQPMPKVILFDPRFVSSKYLALEFLREIDAISSLLSDQEIERTRKAAAAISGPAACDLADAGAEMAGMYRELTSLAFERVGIGSAHNGRFIAPVCSYISWISAAGKIDPSSVWKRSTAIVSSDYARLTSGAPAGGGDGAIGQQIRFDVRHDDLLRSDSVARAVVDLLESEYSTKEPESDVTTADR